MKIPKKITPVPIIYAIVQIGFNTSIENDVVIGLIYKNLVNKYSHFKSIGIPDDLRKVKEFRNFPVIELSEEGYTVKVGYDNVTLEINNEIYTGWKDFSENIDNIIQSMSLIEIDSIWKVALKYVNFFPGIENINEIIKFDMNLHDIPHSLNNSRHEFLLSFQKISSKLSVLDGMTVDSYNDIGSIIEIDTFIKEAKGIDMSNLKLMIEKLHSQEKMLFFSLLEDDFLQKFNPEY